MRVKKKQGGLVAQAIAGTHVVYLGWDIPDKSARRGLLGFAIQRTDHTEGETYWLRGMKCFPDTKPSLPPGGDASSHEQPIQSFQWGDYTAKPEHQYTYTIVPMYGEPGALKDGKALALDITTESESGDTHEVFFNRGAVASQEYVRRFRDKLPAQVPGGAAYTWLSRGLLEAILEFIGEAKDASYSLYGAIYEFQWPAVLDALKAASDRGAAINVVFDSITNKDMQPVTPNKKAIKAAGIGDVTTPFTDGKLMHNKFMVLTRKNGAKESPVAVWTGSTNITENGIFGHLNCGHRVNDAGIAGQYWDYWGQLADDPGSAAIRAWTGQNTPAPDVPPAKGVTTAYSPQTGLATLQAYADIANAAKTALFMTFAFGMGKQFLPVYQQKDDIIRYALMDKEGNGAGLAQGKKDVAAIRKLPNVYVAVGHNIAVNDFDRWVKEPHGAVQGAHVPWIHTKFMIVDPFGPDPVVITGSANFSEASTTTNEENMLIIRGDKRVADIYFGEYMRTFAHYAFRQAVYEHTQAGGKADDWTPQFLAADDSWLADYVKPGSRGEAKRLYFSGQ